jgi:TatD DNase family protein
MFRLISEHNVKSAVFHCYTDSLDNAKKILDLGYYLSFSGIITFRNADDLRGVVRYVPQDRFLVETDCPYLTPVPHRGRLNEPAFTYLVAEHVAKIKGIPIDKVSEITTNNFFNLFPKAKFLLEEGNDE